MSESTVFIILLIYGLIIAGVGLYIERKSEMGLPPFLQKVIYILAFTVFCTSWTIYGSIGKASESGISYLAIYLGASLSLWISGPLIKKMVHLKNTHRITSIPDLLATRFGKSRAVGFLATAILFSVLVPYIGLQIKALHSTFHIMTSSASSEFEISSITFELILVVLVTLIAIFFGLKKLDPTERHPGLMGSLAFEGVVKLAAVILASTFIIFKLSSGPAELFEQAQALIPVAMPSASVWITSMLLSMAAIIFLPRQFHVMVVENSNPKDVDSLRTAMPLYMILINVFVLPVAIYALSNGFNSGNIEFSLLSIPLKNNELPLATLVFLGGVSASVGMIVIALTAGASMVSNNILVPFFNQIPIFHPLNRFILQQRWVIAFLMAFFAYLFQKLASGQALVSMGMISFAGISQLVPSIIAGLYSRVFSKKGTLLAMAFGFFTWFYTLFLPTFMKSGNLDASILSSGPMGIEWLRPESLFGLSSLDNLSHSVFWSLFFNISALVLGSLIFPSDEEETQTSADFFLEDLSADGRFVGVSSDKKMSGNFEEKKLKIVDILFRFLPMNQVQDLVSEAMKKVAIADNEQPTLLQYADFVTETEKSLSGMIGSPEAHRLFDEAQVIEKAEKDILTREYAEIISDLRISPQELRQKVDFYIEREAMLKRHIDELDTLVQNKGSELAVKTRMSFMSKMMSQVAHEVNNPLSIIRGSAERIQRMIETNSVSTDALNPIAEKIIKMTVRMANVIGIMVRISADSSAAKESHQMIRIIDVVKSIEEVTAEKMSEIGVVFELDRTEDGPSILGSFSDLSVALLNMVSNSIDAVAELEIRWIKIKVDQLKDSVRVTVSDSGSGIPSYVADKMMNPFFTTKEIGKGMGMGLTISKKIIEEHGGKIYYDSSARNTTFVIEFPLAANSS